MSDPELCTMEKNTLIIGGYGAVGSIITRHLAERFPNKVLVAGRSFNKAQQLAKQLNNTVAPHQFNAATTNDYEILDQVGLVIVCIDLPDSKLAEECIERGINYIDITASQEVIKKIETLDRKAQDKQVTVALSVGLAPGITNLLAQHCIRQAPEKTPVDLFVLLGLGEKHGDAAYRWTFDNIHTVYPIVQNGHTKMIRSFTHPKQTQLAGKRTFYAFNFSDQHTLTDTTASPHVVTRMAFDSKFLTGMIGLLRKPGITRLFNNKRIQNSLIPIFKKSGIGSDVFAVKAATAYNSYSITGNGEGKMTVYVATELAIQIMQQPTPSGVRHIHQLVNDVPEFLTRLKKHDKQIVIDFQVSFS